MRSSEIRTSDWGRPELGPLSWLCRTAPESRDRTRTGPGEGRRWVIAEGSVSCELLGERFPLIGGASSGEKSERPSSSFRLLLTPPRRAYRRLESCTAAAKSSAVLCRGAYRPRRVDATAALSSGRMDHAAAITEANRDDPMSPNVVSLGRAGN